MSQQEMHYEELNRDRSESSYAGYEGMPHHESQYSTGLYGQKLAEPASFKNPTTGQRLALALVSLFLLMIMTFGLIFIGIATDVNAGGAFGLIFALVLFYVAVIVINILFNRKQ